MNYDNNKHEGLVGILKKNVSNNRSQNISQNISAGKDLNTSIDMYNMIDNILGACESSKSKT